MKLRTALGDTLKDLRLEKHRTLRDISGQAGVALGYLSEIERGRKEASSEILESLAVALGISLPEILILTAFNMGWAFPDTPEEILDNYLDTMVVSK